jgi:hypothetical protein
MTRFSIISVVSFLVASAMASAVHPYVPWSGSEKLDVRKIPANAAAPPKANQTTLASKELAFGIGLNILAQQGESAAISELITMFQANGTDPAFFSAAKVSSLPCFADDPRR